ncbi:hypothetical protein ACSD7O_00470 [Methylorubrum extorquens]|uniref:hypothetical protein n=1 Tax=Methylorubrum extorquens TaxID=408 RepID=UPI003F5E1734
MQGSSELNAFIMKAEEARAHGDATERAASRSTWVRRRPSSSPERGPQQSLRVRVSPVAPGSSRKPSTVAGEDLRAILFEDHHGLIDDVVEEIDCIAGERPVL